MIYNGYSLYDKKLKIYLPIQFHKDDVNSLATAYERQAVKDLNSIKQFRECILYHVGTYDDVTGQFEQKKTNTVVIDFDMLLLECLEAEKGE